MKHWVKCFVLIIYNRNCIDKRLAMVLNLVGTNRANVLQIISFYKKQNKRQPNRTAAVLHI